MTEYDEISQLNADRAKTQKLQEAIGYRIHSSTGLSQIFGYFAVVLAFFIYDADGARLVAWFLVYAFVIVSVLQCLLFNHHITERTSKVIGWPLMAAWIIGFVLHIFYLGANKAFPAPQDVYVFFGVILGAAGILLVYIIERPKNEENSS